MSLIKRGSQIIGVVIRIRLGIHQLGLNSPRRAQNTTAISPAQNVRVSDIIAVARHRVSPRFARLMLSNPISENNMSSGANDQFQASITGVP